MSGGRPLPASDQAHPACSRCGLPWPVEEPDELELWAEYWSLLVCPRCFTPVEIAALDGRSLADSTGAPGAVATATEEDDPPHEDLRQAAGP